MKARAGIVRAGIAMTARRAARVRQAAGGRRRRATVAGRGRIVRREETVDAGRVRAGQGRAGIVGGEIVRRAGARRIAGMSRAPCARLRQRS